MSTEILFFFLIAATLVLAGFASGPLVARNASPSLIRRGR